ncbi:amino acid/polyamine transporter I [Exophiala viscosa]|uniref:amino acid/polyamine transporter I n=1 Tax=Exophiala viscosa TaxID=2486360 RepID=UPI0021A0C04F|nr:amino acid/polyamine transporter I [Exophiala viscosa]
MSPTEVPTNALIDQTDDAAVLAALGHEEELNRQFSFFSLAAYAIITANAWTSIAGSLITAIYNGGAPGLLYGWIVDNFFYFFIALSLAELVSSMPTSAGVYHWSAALAGPEYSKIIGFMTGYMNVLGWTLGLASLFAVTGLEVTGLYSLWHPGYESKTWHVFVVFVVLNWMFAAFIQFGNKWLPLYNKIGLFFNIAAWLVVLICLASIPPTHSTNAFVWTDYSNLTGWPNGMSFILGLVAPAFAIGTIDSTTHMAEEIPHPSRNVPRAMFIQWLGTFLLGFLFLIALFYVAGSLDTILAANPTFPVASIMNSAFDNKNAAFACGLIIFLASLPCSIGAQITTVRCTWSFARDGALPFSSYFAKVDEKNVMPARANILIASISTALGAIYVGSTIAFNALVASYAVMSTTSYGIAIGVHLFTGRKRIIPGWFHMGNGPLGFFVNSVAMIYIVVTNVFFCLPYFVPPVTAATMNYTSLVSYGLALLVVVWWFVGGKRSYKGPKLSSQTLEALEGVPVGNTLAAEPKDGASTVYRGSKTAAEFSKET